LPWAATGGPLVTQKLLQLLQPREHSDAER
jgi:hypothetical protein